MVALAIAACDDDDDGGDIGGITGGEFALTWTLTAGDALITCAEAGVDTISVLATLEQTGEGFEDLFPCEDGSGVTGRLPLGDYTVVVSALDVRGEPLGTSQPVSESLLFSGDLVDLGDFVFDFPPLGDVHFSVDYGAPGGSNCAAGFGGEIVDLQSTTLALVGSDACFPATLVVDNAVDVEDICTELAPCIERTQHQVLLDLPPDEYDLVIEGVFERDGVTTACFGAVFTFQVDGDVDLGTLMVPFDPVDDPAFCSAI